MMKKFIALLIIFAMFSMVSVVLAQREMQDVGSQGGQPEGEIEQLPVEEYPEQPTEPTREQMPVEAPIPVSVQPVSQQIITQPARTTAQNVAQSAVPAQKQISDKITLELKNMDVVEVIKLLSSKGGFDVVISQNVRGRITLFLNSVPIWDAMLIVFKTTDLAYTKHGDIIRIVTEREYEQQYGKKFNDNREVEIIHLMNASINDVGRELKQLKSRVGNVIEDDRTNSVILLDTPDSIKLMKDTIAKLDVPVETRIFELKYTPAKSLEEMLKKLISKKGVLHVDDLTNKIIITDTPDVLVQVDRVVREYDKEQYLQTKIFTLNYAKFDKVEEKIKDLITKDVGMVKSDERTNKVVVTDLPEKIAEIERIILAYDEKGRQVLIEAKIVQVSLNDAFKMGINWQLVLNQALVEKFFHTDTINMTLSSVFGILSEAAVPDTAPKPPFDSRGATNPGGRSLISGTLKDGSDFDSIIDVLKTVGNTNLLSSPRILAVNNQEASIRVVTRQAFVTNTVVQATSSATTAENVTFIDVGVKLTVTPTIGKDGFITLKIKPEVSHVTDFLPTAQNNRIPIVATQEAETVIMVKDGSTVIMGGLIEDQQIKTTSKVPILGSIPILGIPFRKEEDTIKKGELVIFLTPHIVTGEMDLNTPSPKMAKYLDDLEKEKQKAADDVNLEEKPMAEPVKKEANYNFNSRRRN